MKQRLYDFIPVKHLCVGMSLCGIVAGTQTAQASPVFGQLSGLELPSPSIYQQSTKQISGIVKDQAHQVFRVVQHAHGSGEILFALPRSITEYDYLIQFLRIFF